MGDDDTQVDDATLAGTRDAEVSRVPSELTIESGARLGRYVVLQRLGSGGMGVVYAAYDAQLDRKVALKLLRTQGSELARIRLLREAQALARLSHPNVVQVYEIGELGEQAYLVMEFVDGITLAAWRRERARSRADILDVFVAAGRGLAAAHAAGLVHRDFKPDNVMIRGDGRVLVMDFGLAVGEASRASDEPQAEPEPRRSGSMLASSGELTATGALLGTPAYMAPEQFLALGADAQTDQFGFCVALWEALYGARPFAGKDLVALTLAVTSGELVRPEHDELPRWLREVIERGLAREPSGRWPSMQALLDALTHDPTRRRRVVLSVAGSLALLLGATLGVLLVQDRREDEQRELCAREGEAIRDAWRPSTIAALERRFVASELNIAEACWRASAAVLDEYALAWAAMREQTCVETTIEHTRSPESHEQITSCLDERRAALEGLLAAWDVVDADVVLRAPLAVAELPSIASCSETGSKLARPAPPAELREPVARIRIELERTRALQQAGKFDVAETRAKQLVSEAEALGWLPLLVEARLQLGLGLDDRNELEASYALTRATALDALASGHDLALLEAVLALTYLTGERLVRVEEGLAWSELALRLIERLDLEGTLLDARAHHATAVVEFVAGHYDRALEHAEQALALREATLGPNHVDTAASLESIGDTLVQQSRLDEAYEHYSRARRIREDALGPEHLEIAHTYNSLGSIDVQRGRLDEGLVSYQKSRAIVERIHGPDHPELAPVDNNIGVIHWQKGDLQAALASYTHAYELLSRAFGPDSPRAIATLDNLGNLHSDLGHYDEAIAAHRRTLAVREATFGPSHVDVASSLNNLGTVLALLERDDEAIVLLERAHAIWLESVGPQHPHTAIALINIADLHRRKGELVRAVDEFERARGVLEQLLGAEHPMLAYIHVGLARIDLARGEPQAARTKLERALALRSEGGAARDEVGEVRFELALLDAAAGETAKAEQLAATARADYLASGKARPNELARIDAWLAGRR